MLQSEHEQATRTSVACHQASCRNRTLLIPRYSGDHIDRLLAFAARSGKPWCLLLPNWVSRRPGYDAFLRNGDGGLCFNKLASISLLLFFCGSAS